MNDGPQLGRVAESGDREQKEEEEVGGGAFVLLSPRSA